MRRVTLFAVLVFCFFATAVLASDHITISRNWKDNTSNLQGTLAVNVQHTYVDANGQQHTSTTTEWVYVNVRLLNAQPLRKGETEYFSVSGYSSGSGGNINIHVSPEHTYYAYSSGWSTAFGSGGSVYVNLTHNGRIKNVPPITINEAKAVFTTVDKPFKLTFNDFALAENADSDTSYSFEIKRSVFLFPDKLVAKGVVKGNQSPLSEILVTKDSPFCEEGVEYFKSGKKYVVNLRLKRENSAFYTDKFSMEGSFKFKWEKNKGIVCCEKVETVNNDALKQGKRFDHIYDKK